MPVPGQFRTETQRSSEYRIRYALYRTDPDLQEAHRLFPWIVTWDDHEVENNYAGDDPEGHPPARFLERRAAAYQAYYEHLPLRLASHAGRPERAALPARSATATSPSSACWTPGSTGATRPAVGASSRGAQPASIPRPR